MLEIDLRDLADRKHGGTFSVKDVRYWDGQAVLELETSVEQRGSSDYYYRRNWQEAHIRLPFSVITKLVEAVVADWQQLVREKWQAEMGALSTPKRTATGPPGTVGNMTNVAESTK
ncbi:MAG: hypothetical protein ACJ8F2_09340 [Xanthobacteraceae bacterium]